MAAECPKNIDSNIEALQGGLYISLQLSSFKQRIRRHPYLANFFTTYIDIIYEKLIHKLLIGSYQAALYFSMKPVNCYTIGLNISIKLPRSSLFDQSFKTKSLLYHENIGCIRNRADGERH